MNLTLFRPPGFNPWLALSRQPAMHDAASRQLLSELSQEIPEVATARSALLRSFDEGASIAWSKQFNAKMRDRRLANGREHAKGLASAYFRRVGSMDLDPSILR